MSAAEAFSPGVSAPSALKPARTTITNATPVRQSHLALPAIPVPVVLELLMVGSFRSAPQSVGALETTLGRPRPEHIGAALERDSVLAPIAKSRGKGERCTHVEAADAADRGLGCCAGLLGDVRGPHAPARAPPERPGFHGRLLRRGPGAGHGRPADRAPAAPQPDRVDHAGGCAVVDALLRVPARLRLDAADQSRLVALALRLADRGRVHLPERAPAHSPLAQGRDCRRFVLHRLPVHRDRRSGAVRSAG